MQGILYLAIPKIRAILKSISFFLSTRSKTMTLNLKALALSGGRRLWAALKVITRLGYRGVCAGVSVLGWFLASVDWEDVEVPDVPLGDDDETDRPTWKTFRDDPRYPNHMHPSEAREYWLPHPD